MLYVNTLILEITRRCNMSCEHCLRGNAQNLDMPFEYIDKVLNSVDVINSVCFTGGEPALNLDAIRYFYKKAEELGKLPMSFEVITNGMVNAEGLAIELLKAYGKSESKEMCFVAISGDEFHEILPHELSGHILRGLAFYSPVKEGLFTNKSILIEGRGEEMYESGDWNDTYKFKVKGGDIIPKLDKDTIETLYVSANGKITGNCDLSYNTIDQTVNLTIDDLITFSKI